MNKGLIFHSFDNNKNADEFYDIKLSEFIKLLDYLKKNSLQDYVFITFDDGFKSTLKAVEESLARGFKTIAYIITDSINKDGFLNEEEIRYLKKIGCTIGSHTKSHANLKLLNHESFLEELEHSKSILTKIINSEILDLSIPYGEENSKILKEAKKYYKRIAISKPYFRDENSIIGRISIHSSNHFKHHWISKIISRKYDFSYTLKIYFIKILKSIIPKKLYLKIKNYISSKNSRDVFGNNF